MKSYLKTLLTIVILCATSLMLSGCVTTFTARCYGLACGTPYDYNSNPTFIESGTEQPTYRHYRPWY